MSKKNSDEENRELSELAYKDLEQMIEDQGLSNYYIWRVTGKERETLIVIE